MFAVKGWAVPTANLKSEATGASAAGTGSNSVPVTKKRKRPHSKPKVTVTEENVAELWEKFIQNKKPRVEGDKEDETDKNDKPIAPEKAKPKKSKKAKEAKKDATHDKPEAGDTPASVDQKADEDDEWNGIDEEPQDAAQPPSKAPEKSSKPKVAKDKKAESKIPKDEAPKPKKDSTNAKPDTAAAAVASKPSGPKLTPLQASMREKLISARFRHLNETLYTRPSAEAFNLFKTSPDMFTEYHEGFRRQVAVWPENPIDGYIGDILARARVKPPRADNGRQHRHQRQQQQNQPPPTGNKLPLPRSSAHDGTCTIADLGCGDAALAAALAPHARRLRLDVRSFDLQRPDGANAALVTPADVADLPLPDGSVDVAVFCLALMGTNWVDFVEEAYRVLRWRGELWVAEIKSRFAGGAAAAAKGKGRVVEHSVGHRRNVAAAVAAAVPGPKSKAGKAGKAEEASKAEAELAVEVDGAEDRRHETDVSAFVDVLAKRGFVLRGDPAEAVDLSNRMFVKMYFVKGATPVKGKGAAAAAAAGRPAAKTKKFITDDEVEVDEAAVLKPCVYKVR